MKNKAFDAEYFSTGVYGDYLNFFREEGMDIAEKLIKAIKPKKSWVFLDVGCGMGGLVMALKSKGFKAFGTEISDFCLKNSPAKKWIKFIDAQKLSFQDNQFDVVCTHDVIYYLPRAKAKKAIKEMARVSKNFIFLETISKGSKFSKQKINPDNLRKSDYLLSEKQICKIMEENGFNVFQSLFPKSQEDFSVIFQKRIT